MRSKWMLWAWSQESVTSCPTKAVLLALADHADDVGFCRPSIERLSKFACLDPRTVQRQLKTLEGLGLIRREIGGGWMTKSGTKNEGRASSYQLIGDYNAAASGEIHPGAVPPKIVSTPAERRLGNDVESIVPRRSAALTEVSKKVGGGSAHGCEHTHASEPVPGPTPSAQRQVKVAKIGNRLPAPPAHQIDAQRLGELLEAAGWAAIERRPNGDDLREVRAWGDVLGLCHADQLEVIREVLPTKPEPGPPDRLRYFSKAMKRLADKLALPPMKIIYQNKNQGERANEPSRKRDQLPAYLLLAARGTTG